MTEWQTLELFGLPSEADAELLLFSAASLETAGSRFEWLPAMLGRVGFTGRKGESRDCLSPDGESRVLVLGVGEGLPQSEQEGLALSAFLLDAMTQHRLSTLRTPCPADVGAESVRDALVLGVLLHGFRLAPAPRAAEQAFSPKGLVLADASEPTLQSLRRLADAINRARAWVEQPANRLTPRAWIEEVQQIFASLNARVTVLGPEDLTKIGAHALLAVGRGSEHGAHLLIVEWRGDPQREGWDAALVGKGLTFDAGGLNLKPRPGIAKMKLDMAGGAAVLGALELAIGRGSRANVVSLVPIAENAIDALAFRPGDVLTSLSGLTIEVADTDAEGRLVLADAITYAIRHYAPRKVVDAATLTTAVTGVLHEEFAGLYASDEALAHQLMAAGEHVGERLWRLPLDRSQDYLVESEIADASNLGAPGYFGKGEGSPTAGAKFLEKFSQGTRWAHIDLCGTAWASRRTLRSGKGATGYGVALLDRWLAVIEGELGQ